MRILNIEPGNATRRPHREILFHVPHRHPWRSRSPADAGRGHRRRSDAVRPVRETETVPLLEAYGRVLAADLPARLDVPPHDNSAMDGFALYRADLQADGPTRLPVIGQALAGIRMPASFRAAWRCASPPAPLASNWTGCRDHAGTVRDHAG